MNFFQFIIWTMVGQVITQSLGEVLSHIYHYKYKLCDIGMISRQYFKLMVRFIVGCPIFGLVCSKYYSYNGGNPWMGFIMGVGISFMIVLISDARRYSIIVAALKKLNIDNNADFEKFIEENINK